MEVCSSDSGWPDSYAPPPKHPRLTTRYCGKCRAALICGERSSSTACGDPAEYDPDDLHPVKNPRIGVEDLELPSGFESHSIALTPALVIAKEKVGTLPFAVSADRLTGKSFNAVEKGIAVLVGQDDVIDKLWHTRGNIGTRLKKAGYELVITPAFSTWWESSVMERMGSVRYSAEMSVDLSRQISVVPTLPWGNYRDLERSADWVAQEEIQCIAVHLGAEDAYVFDWMLQGVEILSRLLEQPRRLVVIGPSTVDRITRLGDIWPGEMTIASQRPWLKGKHGHRLLPDLTYEQDWSLSLSEVVDANAKMFCIVVESLLRQPKLRLVANI
jgi:hypothetical protein